jgi:glyceraldehyde 3-phosphate dehydrogenase
MKNSMRVAINGFGRIGRITLRRLLTNPKVTVVAINDLADAATLAHLLKYDSIHRGLGANIKAEGTNLCIDEQIITCYALNDPAMLPWKDLSVDIVIESTGKFLTSELAAKHLQAGAGRVILSAPAADKQIPTLVLGVNDSQIDWSAKIISNASCTTNNVAPMVKILDELGGIEDGYITTVHSYTSDQNLHDAPHRDLRRARAAAVSMIPTSTGAAKAITSIFPHLTGKLGGAGIRVPVPNGSLTDFTCILKKQVTVAQINEAFLNASQNSLKGIMQYTADPIVSIDIQENTHSCVFDSELTSVVGRLVKVVGWYDNEWAYSSRIADIVERIRLID